MVLVLILILSFVLVSIKEDISLSKNKLKASSVDSMFDLPSEMKYRHPGITSQNLCRLEVGAVSVGKNVFRFVVRFLAEIACKCFSVPVFSQVSHHNF